MDVFISYSRQDRALRASGGEDIVSLLQKAFTDNGISYWIDEEEIHSGESFASVISRNIALCHIFLFISSANSNASRWTCGEIATASTYEKRIIPFRIDDTPYDGSIAIYVAALDAIDYHKDPEKAMRRLIKSVKRYLDEKEMEQRRLEEQRLAEEIKEKNQKEADRLRKEYIKGIESLIVSQNEIENKLSATAAKLEGLNQEKGELLEELTRVKSEIALLANDPYNPNRREKTKKLLQKWVGDTADPFIGYNKKVCFYLEHKANTMYHQKGEFQAIEVSEIELGRGEGCQVQFDESCTTVSRRHAAIVKDSGSWKIINLSKTNATLVNGEAIDGETVLASGDEIRLSQSGPLMTFYIPQKRIRHRKWLWFGLSLIILLLIGCCFCFGFLSF